MTVNAITQFKGEYAFLSNFYIEGVLHGGRWYPSAEHIYQSAKMADHDDFILVANQKTPGQAKKKAHALPMRIDWEFKKLGVMYDAVYSKFTCHDYLRDQLLATGDAVLVEGNNWGDTFWGVCDGIGENWLGKILMAVRDRLRNEP